MTKEELEPQNEFRLPRIEVRMPEPATWKLTAAELKRYEDSKLIIRNEEDTDVKFRRKVDADHASEVKAAQVGALAEAVLDKPGKLSVVTAMREKAVSVFKKEKELLADGVLATEISHAPDKMHKVFRKGKPGPNSYTIRTGGGTGAAYELRITRRNHLSVRSETPARSVVEEEDNSVTFVLTQEQGPWSGSVEVNVPFSSDEKTAGGLVPDPANSRIIAASGFLERMNFADAATLVISTVNAAAEDFERAANEVDSVFKDAELRRLSKKDDQ